MKARNVLPSFFLRVLISLLAINLATVGVLSYIGYSYIEKSLLAQAGSNLDQQADILADVFHKAYRQETYRLLKDLIESPLIDDYLSGSAGERMIVGRRMQHRFLRVTQDFPAFSSIHFVTENGESAVAVQDRQRSDPHALAGNQGVAAEIRNRRSLITQLVNTPLLLSSGVLEWFMPPREIHLSEPYAGADGGLRVMAGIAKLDTDTGEFGGAIIVSLDLQAWLEQMSEIHFLEANPVWIFGPTGKVHLTAKTLANSFDPAPFMTLDEAPERLSAAVSQGLLVQRDLALKQDEPFFRMVMAVPTKVLFSDIEPVIRFFSYVVVGSILILVALSLIISRLLSIPVKQLILTRNQLANAQRIARLGHWQWIERGNVFELSENARAILGREADEHLLGYDDFVAALHTEDREKFTDLMNRARFQGQAASAEMKLLVPGQPTRYVHQEVEVLDDAGRSVIGTVQDIGERKRSEREIHRLAYFDSVTGLANRTLLNSLAGSALQRAAESGHSVAVIFLDLDRFKYVNDTIGHDAGDELLRQVARRIQQSVRPSDSVTPASDMPEGERAVARLGGDEFIVLLSRLDGEANALRVADRIQTSLGRPFLIDNREINASASMGISLYPQHGDSVDALLKHADAAMYHAKAKGRKRIELFTTDLDSAIRRRLGMESRVTKAARDEAFVLHYQPRVDLASGRICAVEALVRWLDPVEGLIEPERFIPLAEEIGLIDAIGDWVFRTACTQLYEWRTGLMPDLKISVNLSPTQFASQNLFSVISSALGEAHIAPTAIELELTESTLFKDVESGIALARELTAMGIKMSIDDFGTGYSSLQMLKRFPVVTLKIDKSFISDLLVDKDDELIVKSAISLGHNLGLRVVAEGVEHAGQLEFLRQAGCDEVQGFLLGRPMPANEMTAFFKRNTVVKLKTGPGSVA